MRCAGRSITLVHPTWIPQWRLIVSPRKNKATEYHLGLLKGKLARLRAQLLEPAPGERSSGGGSGFDVSKSGGMNICIQQQGAYSTPNYANGTSL